jgi:hypothetical protein
VKEDKGLLGKKTQACVNVDTGLVSRLT